MVGEDHKGGIGAREGASVEHRDSENGLDDSKGLDHGSNRTFSGAVEAGQVSEKSQLSPDEQRILVLEFAKKLVKTFEGTGMRVTPDELERDGVATVELDKLIIRTLRKMVDKGIQSPLMMLSMGFLWDNDFLQLGSSSQRDWAERAVAYRVTCTAVLLEKYRHLQRIRRNGGDVMHKPIEVGSLFDQRSGLVNGKTSLADKLTAYKKILMARGIIPGRSP